VPTWICIHGHFYQPPRENPWLDAIEPQPSAHPYPDWNARITAECYRPNASARIVDGEGRIVQIVDNYARMSFDVGPTLMSWFEREAPDVHRALVDADHRSRARFGGHGSAMAQAYNHVIMPLASSRDRCTQVRWGIADFRHRFGRAPDAMWLPECAVDTASLEALAAEGIAFTVLAPHQARRLRAPGGPWQEAAGRLDTGRVYVCRLPSGRSIDLFFYDGGTSQAVAFERLLADGNRFVARLVGDEPPVDDDAGLRHVATDGETYGHHHRYGDMALAWALSTVDRGDHPGVRLTNYAEFRARFPASWEVEIVEDSSWSCAHGVERWRADCGCSSGGHPGWRQAWRGPLRAALDWLRDRAAALFEREAVVLLEDPWAARDAYIDVLLDRTPERIRAFLALHARRTVQGLAPADLGDPEVVRVLELMELQRHAMLMYTSCGWFFDELSGIETVQVLAYAARVCELAEKLGGEPVEAGFVARLATARSNLERYGDGRAIWDQLVRPQRVDLEKVVAHYAVAAATAVSGDDAPDGIYAYDVEPIDVMVRRAGKARLIAGRVRCTSRITQEAAELSFAALHLGEHILSGGVRPSRGAVAWRALRDALGDAFASADFLAAQRTIAEAFPATFSLASLFRRERDRAIGQILDSSLRDAESAFRRIYDEYAPLMRFLVKLAVPVPETFRDAAELVLRHRVLAALRREVPVYDEVRDCIREADEVKADLDVPEVAYAAGEALHRMIDRFAGGDDPTLLEQLARMAEIAARMESGVDLWHAQNACVALREQRLPAWRRRAGQGDAAAERLAVAFARLCAAIHVYVEA
jgi:alpha-amylase/alpha-mannosidase (GH57 family)